MPWSLVDGGDSAAALSEKLSHRIAGRLNRGTAIGDALNYSARLLRQGPYAGTRRIVDLSGDGISNQGRPVAAGRAALLELGATINGLPIAYPDGEANPQDGAEATLRPEVLVRYFRDDVIGGPGAFIEPVLSPDSYAKAIRHKLLREITGGDVVAAASAARRDDMADAGPVER